MSLYWYIFSVSLLCIVQEINSTSDTVFSIYHIYAPSDHNVTRGKTVNSDDLNKTYHSVEISEDKVKRTEHIFRIYDSYQQRKVKRSRRSYNTSNLPQNRRSNSTGRVVSFKAYEINDNSLVNAKYNLTRNPNFIGTKNNSVDRNTFQRRRQEGMFLKTTAPVSNNRLTYFNKEVLNNSLSWRNNLINFVNITSNPLYDYTNNQLDNLNLINRNINSNRWFRRKRSQSNSNNYNLLNYKFNEKLSKVQRNGEKYSTIKHLVKRQLKDKIISESNNGPTLQILEKLTTPTETNEIEKNKKLKIHKVLPYDEMVNVKPLLQFTTLTVINEPHGDTVMIQVPNRRTPCAPPRRLAQGRCRDVW